MLVLFLVNLKSANVSQISNLKKYEFSTLHIDIPYDKSKTMLFDITEIELVSPQYYR